MTISLTALQQTLLATAAARPDGSLFPVAGSTPATPARVRKAVAVLLDRDLVQEVDVAGAEQAWRRDGERHIGACISNAGRDAIGMTLVEDTPVVAEAPAPRPTKIAQVMTLLRREQGATLAELVTATGWLPHTTRAALTGLRKKAHAIERDKRGEITCYRIVEAA